MGRCGRSTTNQLALSLHNDNVLILDEIGQVAAAEAGECAYLLANGQGKIRANRNGMAKRSMTWRLLFLSSGEETLTSLMAKAGKKPTVGQEVRLAKIEGGSDAGMGIMEELHEIDSPGSFIEQIRAVPRSSSISGQIERVGGVLDWLLLQARSLLLIA